MLSIIIFVQRAKVDTSMLRRQTACMPSLPARPGLILAAWAPELEVLRRFFRGVGREYQGRVEMGVVGVGLVEAAAGAAEAMARHNPRFVILVGTAGVFGAVKLTGAVAVSDMRLGFVEPANVAEVPAPMPQSALPSLRLTASLARAARLSKATVACPLAVTRGAAYGRRMREATDAQLENLESFAVARAARRAKVPFAAVLGVANTVGPQGFDQWRANGAAAAAQACLAVATWLACPGSVAWIGPVNPKRA